MMIAAPASATDRVRCAIDMIAPTAIDRRRSTTRSLDRRRHGHGHLRLVEPSPRVVALLGMHRSGASAIMHLLHRLGVPADGDLAPPAGEIPRGVWESRRIVQAHDRLFARFGSSWTRARLTAPLPDAWQRDTEVVAIRRELVRILRCALSENYGLWGFKDPRTVRFLPLWREVFAEVGARPFWILAVRHPAAVIDSLAARSKLPRERCELLWIEHNLDALSNLDRQDLLVLSFERLLADPPGQLRRVLRRLPFLPEPADGDLAAIVEATLDASTAHRRGAVTGCTETAAMIHGWLEAMARDQPLPAATPAEITAAAARDLARLADRERTSAEIRTAV